MRMILLGAAGLLAGCGGSGIGGIWTLQLPYEADTACVDTLSHNFLDAAEPEAGEIEDDGWTEESTDSVSDLLMFVQIEETDKKDNAVLVMGGEAWPGFQTGKGRWTFSWTGEEQSTDSISHESGYTFTSDLLALSEEQLVLTIDSGIGGGTWELASSAEQSWTEPDSWAEELGLDPGQIPSAMYLVSTEEEGEAFGGGGAQPVVNTREGQDCDSSPCRLTVATVCDSSIPLTMTRTTYEDEEAYAHLIGSGQGYGAN